MLGNTEKSEMDLKRAFKYDKANTQKFIDKKQDIFLNVFP